MTPLSPAPFVDQLSVELKRILASALLACLLVALSAALDGPVSILAWLLLAGGFLCLVYVVVASRHLLNYYRSQHDNAQST